MGFLKTGSTEMQIYLTEYGKKKMLEQSFHPMQFTLNDSDVNYLTNTVMTKAVVDVSGDYDDNVFSLSKWQNIGGSIIRRVNTTTTSQTVIPTNLTLEQLNQTAEQTSVA
jgi:hypothetical protein